METSNPPTMQVESAGRTQLPAEDAMCGPGGYENITLSMESQELRIRNRNSEEMARIELEAMERDARCAYSIQINNFKIAVRENQRQKRCRQSGCERIFRQLRNYDDAKNFKVFGIDMKDEWKKMKGERHR